jgi:hypothetical protein
MLHPHVYLCRPLRRKVKSINELPAIWDGRQSSFGAWLFAIFLAALRKIPTFDLPQRR